MTNSNSSKWMNISLWVVQGLLAVMFLMAGANKLFQSIPELSKMLPWVTQVPEGLVRFIGFSELLGGIGLLLPAILRIKRIRTSLCSNRACCRYAFSFHFSYFKRGNVSYRNELRIYGYGTICSLG